MPGILPYSRFPIMLRALPPIIDSNNKGHFVLCNTWHSKQDIFRILLRNKIGPEYVMFKISGKKHNYEKPLYLELISYIYKRKTRGFHYSL